ncbi:MAG: glutamine-hydrolyzing carbamoyl-phosphate synthase small subunit [Deferribacteres bacterium]|nr:glutamine-hydrolyzing carbamoyl-phosphate synthase small subunit [candidate division KSB1 bacterium]MCB9501805.1 glutamine-hydrolyzing carbamoyl-phosphate synthase small subunit [Deferribacteres bacterium]
MSAKLVLEDGTILFGTAFGATKSTFGEVVFNTGMVGYPETLTDPSYTGQILVLTYPLVGNYGIAERSFEDNMHRFFESEKIHLSGLVVSELSHKYSHWNAEISLDAWLQEQNVPGIYGIDTRLLTQKLRTRGAMLGKLIMREEYLDFFDPNSENLVAKASRKVPQTFGKGKKKVVVIDCGCKNNIIRSLISRGVETQVVPWNWPVEKEEFDGVLISNGPGDPIQAEKTVQTVRELFDAGKPILGICMGNQILSLAAGARTYKLKYGHRSQNQPCIQVGSKRCYITSQNHGYAVDENTLPPEWSPWFFNANDGTNEGIRHNSKPFMSVQFHPEATPGPVDTNFIFDDFVQML